MKVGKYTVFWHYHGSAVAANGLAPFETQCVIMDAVAVEGQMGERHGYGVARVAAMDIYDKDKGRKISLQRALRSMDTMAYGDPATRREFRAQAWEAYRTMTKIPRWEVPSPNRQPNRGAA